LLEKQRKVLKCSYLVITAYQTQQRDQVYPKLVFGVEGGRRWQKEEEKEMISREYFSYFVNKMN